MTFKVRILPFREAWDTIYKHKFPTDEKRKQALGGCTLFYGQLKARISKDPRWNSRQNNLQTVREMVAELEVEYGPIFEIYEDTL